MKKSTNVIVQGEITKTKKILVMVHGRGGSAGDIMSLAKYLPVGDFTLIAPQANGSTWYPYSFMAPQVQNEPHLTNSLIQLDEIVRQAADEDVPYENIFFLGFSQGACLTLEYVTRHAKKWGGIIAFTGGLIGEKLNTSNYKGDFEGTKIYIGTSNPDPHVPVTRVKETEKILNKMNADVKIEIFDNMGHTIIQQELNSAIDILS